MYQQLDVYITTYKEKDYLSHFFALAAEHLQHLASPHQICALQIENY